MKTAIVDDRKRVRIPTLKPRQVFAYNTEPNGTITLIPIKPPEKKEPFPPGSLLKYFTPEKDREEMALLAGCVQGPE